MHARSLAAMSKTQYAADYGHSTALTHYAELFSRGAVKRVEITATRRRVTIGEE